MRWAATTRYGKNGGAEIVTSYEAGSENIASA
jgi:hypothetical protein